jgi:hypothetical protein
MADSAPSSSSRGREEKEGSAAPSLAAAGGWASLPENRVDATPGDAAKAAAGLSDKAPPAEQTMGETGPLAQAKAVAAQGPSGGRAQLAPVLAATAAATAAAAGGLG